ncbi:uncharacterized protein MELLADRAFT_96335 [Melampsora larici-populina 98AG31]|uniref:Uncharacterized protein n=1 Tax=Melampsora larici-populina (strain 98AG31 / pathotype 3-4-7) TaxID=747676 RepID=F4REE3_MELLP|nr:uncharacterized protein MELLADRAFT_96335 [Melampsora larici-populina 98AG31]EGG09286.1 hypothetical protein MELLADRAFT_96335 [Melampsora larici-populina 98AG31]
MPSRTTTITTHHHSTQLNMPSTSSSSNTRKPIRDRLLNNTHQNQTLQPLTRRRSARTSNETSTTENTSFGSIVIQPTQNGYHHHQETTLPPTKKRKTNRTPVDSDSDDHPTTSILQNQQNRISHSHHSTPKHHRLGSSQPTGEETNHTPHHHSRNRNKPHTSTLANTTTTSRPAPIPTRQTSGVFTFTTKRFQTPAKPDSSFSADEHRLEPENDSPIEPRSINGYRSTRDNILTNDLRIPDHSSSLLTTSHDTRHSQNSNQRDRKGKGKANGLPNDRPNNRPRSNRNQQSPVSPDRISNGRFTPDSPPTRTRTPKTSKKHPNIYGKKDKTVDGEMPVVMAETPMQIKNKHFRQTGRRDDPSENGSAGDLVESGSSSSSRRASGTSIDRRGGRASSIGNGHEALPHPRVPSDCLHRHIQLDLPPIVRCRTLLSWTSQKADDITKLSLSETFEPSRISFEALPSPVTASVRGLIGRHSNLSKLRIKVIEEVVSKVVKGVCTNQLDLSWFDAPDQPLDTPAIHSRNQFTESTEDLPPNPQDLLNQSKARDLENWRQRLSYEDGARQYELNRYSTLINRLSSPSTKLDDQEQEEIKLDKKTLEDIEVAIKIGRRLRRDDTDHQGDVIDVSKEVQGDWLNVHSQLSILTEKVEILKDKSMRIENQIESRLKECTERLKLIEISEEKRKVERKLNLIGRGEEGEEGNEDEDEEGKEERLGWCLDQWDGFFERNGKRDLLRSISRTLDD